MAVTGIHSPSTAAIDKQYKLFQELASHGYRSDTQRYTQHQQQQYTNDINDSQSSHHMGIAWTNSISTAT